MAKILICTQNNGKMKEYSSILNPLGYELISLADAGILEQADETGTTFEENSLI